MSTNNEIPGQAPHFSDFTDEKKKQSRIAGDLKDYQAAKKKLKNDPNAIEVIGRGSDGSFRDAELQANQYNKKHGTDFKAENQNKIKNKVKVGKMTAHAHQDKITKTVYGAKPVDEKQRSKKDQFKAVGQNMTQKNIKGANQTTGKKSPSGKITSTGKKASEQSSKVKSAAKNGAPPNNKSEASRIKSRAATSQAKTGSSGTSQSGRSTHTAAKGASTGSTQGGTSNSSSGSGSNNTNSNSTNKGRR